MDENFPEEVEANRSNALFAKSKQVCLSWSHHANRILVFLEASDTIHSHRGQRLRSVQGIATVKLTTIIR